jgi:CubicO group peptidase (beta-lactamase class C family)
LISNIDSEIDEYIKKRHYRQINSVLIWKDNEMSAQRYYNGYDENSRNVIKSVAKSIMSICTGIALDKGLIKSLDEPIFSFIPEFNENRDPRHRLITIRHLLTMTSGIYWNGGIHYHCPMMSQMRNSGNWISHIANCAVSDTPGTKYNYKEWDIILLARLFSQKIMSDTIELDKTTILNYKLLFEKIYRFYGSDLEVAIKKGK